MTSLFEEPHGLFDSDGQTLPATEVEKQKELLPAKIAAAEADESRASKLSTVERRIVKDSIHCKQCTENNDPNNVPVHPNCQCNVITDSVEAGVADSTNRMFNPLNVKDLAIEMMSDDAEMPSVIQLNPETVAILDGETVRFADLTRWLEQMQPYLDAGAQYVSIVVDPDSDEAAAEVQEVVEVINNDSEDIVQALQDRKLWFSLAKAVSF